MNHIENGYNDMPYERFLCMGAKALTDCELLAIILRTGTKDKSAVQVAKEVMEVMNLGKYPRNGLLGLYDVSIEELLGVKGVGTVKAVKLKALAELSMRMHKACADIGLRVDSPASVADYYMEDMRHLEHEQVVLAAVDSKGSISAHKVLSVGSVNKALLSPRTVFIEALKLKAVYIILLHNHPGGDPAPSEEDISVTSDISLLGDRLEIRLIDHIIIGDNCYYSFREHDLISSSL